ncbi:uncharacterized protein LOC120357592 [Solenopsis invicta]|uniref:uncharacterized protein LOC120357592 n=1 Tax=Solenopsis invicta TaxID=13686 RepID=UPI00193DCA4B|nr:uncharacterized protein LOC120357592 [Solenopsis invicta]
MLTLNAAGDTRSSNNSKTNRSAATKSLTAAISNVKCLYCAGSHLLFQCAQFKSLSTEQRKNVARQHRCCYNCLTKGHYPRDCKSRGRCARCQRKHHTLLHDDDISGGQTTMGAPAIASTSSVNTVNDAPSKSSLSARVTTPSRSLLVKGTVLLATARIFVRTDGARCINLRGMIDTGAEATFITERAVQVLKAKRIKVYYTVTGMGDLQAGVVTHAVKLHLSEGIQSSTTVTVIAFILPVLTSYAPRSPVDLLAHPHLQNLKFADSDPFSDEPIDLLIGLDYYKAVTMDGSRRGPSSDLMAKPTIFGWVVFGPCNDTSEGNPRSVSSLRCSSSPGTDALMRQFWEIEEVSVSNPLTEEKVECERHFASTHSRLSSGRYQVRLPFRTDYLNKVGRSFHVASGAFDRLERRLARDSALSASYRGFLSEYEQMGHMTRVNPNEVINNNSLYLPHHPVVKASSTSPVRVVFNASSPMDNGHSLNDLLLTEPKLQSDLCSIIMRWRTHRFVFVADVAKMFRQIMIHPLDTDFQRILWRPSSGQPIHHYRLITVTYGTASAPYLSMRVLRQLCEDEGSAFPLAVSILNNSIYVDDVLFGTDSVSAIQSTRQQLNALLLKGGFHLRKWTSNYDELLSEILVSDRLEDNSVEFDEDSSFKVLGISWSPILDRFHFRIQIPEFPVISKRSVLSAISRFFDPLGWIASVVITAKIFMQELWLRKVDWDSLLSSDLEERWTEYSHSLTDLKEISIPRWTNQSNSDLGIELHGFADASTRAYAAVVYIRIIHTRSSFGVTLLACKSKVAPIKTVSVPRLELCAATLLARFLKNIVSTLRLSSVPVYCWSDSMITLAWIKQHPNTWKTFISNRVSEIQTSLPQAQWLFVGSKENPADCASRGISVQELKSHSLWWSGPQWLQSPSTVWSEQPSSLRSDGNMERRSVPVYLAQRGAARWDLSEQVSSWPKLLRIMAYCLLFVHKVRQRLRRADSDQLGTLYVLSDAIRQARSFWIAYVQKINFSNEIQAIKRGEGPSKSSPLKNLNPFLDTKDNLCVGGRLCRASLSYDERHPIILPRHRISELIVAQAHDRTLQGGTQLTLGVLRQQYWILNARNLVKHHIHRCVVCVRHRAIPILQQMGDLPDVRINPSRPFQHTGVDYAGPFHVLPIVGRGQRTHKAYVVVFVCLATRAIHLELANDYTSDGFLAAFRRFTSRRGLPVSLFSDNGTNFQGAEKELRNAFRALSRDPDLVAYLASDGITWRFIPPSAPHFGGMWEAGVKSVKHHLRRVIGAYTLSNEEFTTLLTQVESCLNSRPIAPLSDDPSDLSPLTPAHFLIGTSLIATPEESVLDLRETRLNRWQRVQRMHEQFWRIWSRDYLHMLQQRYKWRQKSTSLKVDDLVLVQNPLLPPTKWELGRVVKIYPDPQGLVRVVDVRTLSNTRRRAVNRLCKLPIEINAELPQ